MKDEELKAIEEACSRLNIVLPHIQAAVSEARAEGDAGLAVTMVTPDGSGRLTAQFEAENFFADLATVSNAALCGVVRERDATMTGEAIAKAIRAFTIDMPNDEPNGPRERQLEVLGQALERGDLRTARRAYGFMCEAGGDDLMALRVAAEAHFGGDFRAASTSCATEEEQG